MQQWSKQEFMSGAVILKREEDAFQSAEMKSW